MLVPALMNLNSGTRHVFETSPIDLGERSSQKVLLQKIYAIELQLINNLICKTYSIELFW